MIEEVKIKQMTLLMIVLSIMVFLPGCGDSGSSITPATPLVLPKIYLTDTFNGRIVRLDDMSGNFSYWTTRSGFFNPKGIYLDSAGKIYVADTGNNRIVRMDDITGTNWTAFAPTGSNQFTSPAGIFVDRGGKIYVSDTGNNQIVLIDDMIGTNRLSLTGFSSPSGIFVDTAGNIYVSDTGNNQIVKIDTTSTRTALTGFLTPSGIFVDSFGKIYVSDTGNNRIIRIDDMTGANWFALGSYGSGLNQFNHPSFAVFQ